MARKVDLRGAKEAKGDTVLHFAACKGCLEICKFLVEESGLDVNLVSKTGAPATCLKFSPHASLLGKACFVLVRDALFPL